MTEKLQEACSAFNQMYKLPITDKPSLHNLGEDWRERLRNFKKTLSEEVDEIDDIVDSNEPNELVNLTNIADLFGDLCVYIHSEAVKFGIPLGQVLQIIMDSNMSKLGADGQPIYNEDGKVMKGPNYWKPEAKIEALIFNTRFPKVNEKVDVVDNAVKYLENNQETAS
jgi:predicted HAD superfamily Cof-like phosphohydrolase